MTSTQIWLTCGVAAFMAVMLGIGFLASRRIRDTRDFIVAGNRLGWFLSIGTIFATWFGAETCMGSSVTAREEGLLGVIADPYGAGLCLIISGCFLVRTLYKLRVNTIIDFFQLRYGANVAKLFSALYIPVYLGWTGAQVLAFGYILNSLTGLPVLPSVIVSTAVVIVYTFAGGMWADSITDFFQMLILVAGLLVIFPILVMDIGGIGAIREKISPEMFHVYPREGGLIPWLGYVQALMLVGLGSLPAQDLFQRIMSPRSATVARYSSIIAGVMYIAIGSIPVLLGILSNAIEIENVGESILIDLALKYLPVPLTALVISVLLAAIMSSADSALLAPAGIISNNIVPFFRPSVSEQGKLKWCRWSIATIGVLSLLIALYFRNIYDLCLNSWGILLVGVVAPMFAGMWWKRASSTGAICGCVAGIASWIAFAVFLPEEFPAQLFGFLVSAATLVSVSLLARRDSKV